MKTAPGKYRKILIFIGSNRFFNLILVLLVLQAGWIALIARYPQAFDEQYHFGIIQLHAKQLGPFLGHASDSAAYGPVSSSPSFLYHYLMSFPYRLVAHFTTSVTAQIIILRLINVGIFAWGLIIFRKVLRHLPVSKALANVTLLLFVMTPVVPLLAAQINYDNLVFMLAGLAVLWCIEFIKHLKEEKTVSVDNLLELIILCLIASMVKYAFLPVFAAIGLVLVGALYKIWRKHEVRIFHQIIGGLKAMSAVRITAYAGTIAICVWLLAGSIGYNLARYHRVSPACDKILTQQQCEQNAIWIRDQYLKQHNPPPSVWSKATFPGAWTDRMVEETMFTVSSRYENGTVAYFTALPLPVIWVAAWAFLIASLLLFIRYAKQLWANDVTRVFIVIGGIYTAILLAQNYLTFLRLKQPVAVHGRYLIPVLILLYGIFLTTFSWFLSSFSSWNKAKIKTWVLVGLCLILLQGGGFITYIVRSDSSWFWPQSQSAQTANWYLQDVLRPIAIGG